MRNSLGLGKVSDMKIKNYLNSKSVLIVFMLLTQFQVWSQKKQLTPLKSVYYSLNQIKLLAEKGDDLGLRIAIKNYLARPQIEWREWSEIRKLLYQSAGVGYDLIFTFEKFAPEKRSVVKKDEKKLEELIESADRLYKEKKYFESFNQFQEAGLLLKKFYRGAKIPIENQQLYFFTLHQMGRALYALGQYDDAIKVYSSIPRSYYQIRQIQFERMWSAFRSQNFSLAVGAIESQRSPYFSKYMEPESYLVKLYILKQLCMTEEIKKTRSEIEEILNLLKTNKYTLTEWAKRDIETLSLFYLATQIKKNQADMSLVNFTQRQAEALKIKDRLSKLFDQDKERLISSYSKILGFSLITENTKASGLKSIVQLKKSTELQASGLEFWPKNDAEDWLDEIGSHYFIGESKCNSAESKK